MSGALGHDAQTLLMHMLEECHKAGVDTMIILEYENRPELGGHRFVITQHPDGSETSQLTSHACFLVDEITGKFVSKEEVEGI